MNKFVYVVYLTGEHVYQGMIIKAVVKCINDADKVRTLIKEDYGIEFEERSACFTSGWWKFTNITDDRDINLVVERVDVLD